ncbi:MAG: NUDIX hydrolase [Candidatus Limnocylindria bacterium]
MPAPVGRALGAAVVLLNARGEVLLVRHSYGRHNWELPGGLSEPGESVADTATREAMEEIGVDVRLERISGIYWEARWRANEDFHHFVFAGRLAEGARPEIRDVAEIRDLGWFPTERLPRPISDFTVRRIRDALEAGPPRIHSVGERVWLE